MSAETEGGIDMLIIVQGFQDGGQDFFFGVGLFWHYFSPSSSGATSSIHGKSIRSKENFSRLQKIFVQRKVNHQAQHPRAATRKRKGC